MKLLALILSCCLLSSNVSLGFQIPNMELKPIDQFSSENGFLAVELNVTSMQLDYGSFTVIRNVYSGHQFVGPTLRIKPGDRVTITLNNQLEPNDLSSITNLHFHGLHLNPLEDNPNIKVNGGESYVYNLNIDENQPAGTFWYHPYVLGGSQEGELVGTIIVEEPEDSPLAPYVYPEKDIEFIVAPSPPFQQDAIVAGIVKLDMPRMMVSGQLEPIMTVSPGHTKRFRIINAGDTSTLELDPPCTETGECCEVVVIAVDGIALDQPLPPINGQTFLAPWQSADWLVTCSQEGIYWINSNPRVENSASLGPDTSRYSGHLASLTTISWGIPTLNVPISLPRRPRFVGDLLYVNDDEITGKFVMDINERVFANLRRNEDPEKAVVVDLKRVITVEGIEEWTLLNSDPKEMKTMHFPLNHVQIISYNEYRGPITYFYNGRSQLVSSNDCSVCEIQCSVLEVPSQPDIKSCPTGTHRQDVKYWANDGAIGLAAIGQWRSVVALPPLTNMTIRFRADKYTGYFLMQSAQYSERPIQFHGHIKERGFQFETEPEDVACALEMGKCDFDDYYPTEPAEKPQMTPMLTRLYSIFQEYPWYKTYVQNLLDSFFQDQNKFV